MYLSAKLNILKHQRLLVISIFDGFITQPTTRQIINVLKGKSIFEVAKSRNSNKLKPHKAVPFKIP